MKKLIVVRRRMKGLRWSVSNLKFSMFSLSLILLTSRPRLYLVQEFTDTDSQGDMPMNVSSPGVYNKGNIFLGVIEYGLNCLISALHLVHFTSVHIRFDLERYLLIIRQIQIQRENSTNPSCRQNTYRISNTSYEWYIHS